MLLQFEEYSYSKPKDARILEACLKRWFANPKDLNLTDPRMAYPFNFKKWIALSYQSKQSHTYVMKENGWIIGMLSLKVDPDLQQAHLFHVFVDRNHRGRGHGKAIAEFAETTARKMGFRKMTLYVLPGNTRAKQLYENLGFKKVGMTKTGTQAMEKDLA